mmetsp:Transcript_79472/g.238130  ORF Transcript_79472/g.238130 Transcript_79472/m.238130 type:complete len:574 (-) Transcript_79472:100-1821(-)
MCRLVDQQPVRGSRLGGHPHQPRRQVDHVAHGRELAALFGAHHAAESTARADTDARAQAVGALAAHQLLEKQRQLDGAQRVVGMRPRRQAEGAEKDGALVVDEHLVELPLHMVYRSLHLEHRRLADRERRGDGRVRRAGLRVGREDQALQVDEHHGHLSHLGQVKLAGEAVLQLERDRQRHVAPHQRHQLTRQPRHAARERRDRRQRREGRLAHRGDEHKGRRVGVGGAIVVPLGGARHALSHIRDDRPRCRRDTRLAGGGTRLGFARLVLRLARQHKLPPPVVAAQVEQRDRAAADPDVEREVQRLARRRVGVGHVVVQPAVELERAAGGAQHGRAQVGRHLRPILRALLARARRDLEHARQRVARKLDDVAAVRVHNLDDGAEEAVHDGAHDLGAVGQRVQLLRQRREPRRVREDDARIRDRAEVRLVGRERARRLERFGELHERAARHEAAPRGHGALAGQPRHLAHRLRCRRLRRRWQRAACRRRRREASVQRAHVGGAGAVGRLRLEERQLRTVPLLEVLRLLPLERLQPVLRPEVTVVGPGRRAALLLRRCRCLHGGWLIVDAGNVL